MYTVYKQRLLSIQLEPRARSCDPGYAARGAVKEDAMQLSELLIYIVLFLASFALGFVHGAKSDIADQREAIRRGALRRAG